MPNEKPAPRLAGMAEYVEETLDGGRLLVARRDLAPLLRAATERETLYAYAARHPDARPLAGRGVAWSIPLTDGTRVVVRHNRHGGTFARLTGDRFLPPTRAPRELDAALRLAAAGIATPAIAGYLRVPAGLGLERADVATIEIPDAQDLARVLTTGDADARRAALDAGARLIGALSRRGARHHDLNVKNILVDADGHAWLLDLDRVVFDAGAPAAVLGQNLARFSRSARKWRAVYGARVDEEDLARVSALAAAAVESASS